MFWDCFYNLCLKQGKAPNKIAKEIGISSGAITKWKSDNIIPRESTLLKIAEYFGVSVNYLLGNEGDGLPNSVKGETEPLDQSNLRMIPLFETVSAGFGAYASDNIRDYIPSYIPNEIEAANTLFIRVRGDSMFPKIEDGDIIQVYKQDSVDSGLISVVLVDGDEGLVKKVSYDKDSVTLESFNPMYPPMVFRGPDLSRVRVVGLVTKVIKGVNGRKIDSVKVSDNKKELLDSIEKMDAEELKRFNEMYNDYIRSKGNN